MGAWIRRDEYQADVLLLAGDVSEDMNLLERVLRGCLERFAKVMFVPGNHDLWVRRCTYDCSLAKFGRIQSSAANWMWQPNLLNTRESSFCRCSLGTTFPSDRWSDRCALVGAIFTLAVGQNRFQIVMP